MLCTDRDLVIFDLDGTLVDTSGDLIRATNHALVKVGERPVRPEALRNACGQGARALLHRALVENGTYALALIDRAVPHLLEYYSRNIYEESVVYDGLEDVLVTLRAAGLGLVVCTNKPEKLARKLIEAVGWSALFDAVIGGDTAAEAKPSAVPLQMAMTLTRRSRPVMVGDSELDAMAAKAAGMPFIGVRLDDGFAVTETLDTPIVIRNYRELPGALRLI